MQIRKRRYIAFLISIIPFNFLRIFFYNLIFHYQISTDSKIGFGTIINVNKARIQKAIISEFNWFDGPFALEIEENTIIGYFNQIRCGVWILQERVKDKKFLAFCRFGKNTIVSRGNSFDAAGGFELGENSVIGGAGSQFWTHGRAMADESIKIGKNCYIAAATRFLPGVNLGNKIFVGVGSVVTKSFYQENCVIAGNPAQIIKENYQWEFIRT